MLTSFGLTPVCERVYHAMVQAPHLGVAEIAESLELTESEVRPALDALIDLTLLRVSREEPERLRPVDPQIGLQILISHQEEELARREREIAIMRARSALLATSQQKSESASLPSQNEYLSGPGALRDRLRELVTDGTTEVNISLPSGVPSELSPGFAVLLEDIVDLGRARLRALLPGTAAQHPVSDLIRGMAERGVALRATPALPPCMLLVDGNVAVLPRNPTAESSDATIVRDTSVLSPLVTTFEQMWLTATALSELRAPDGSANLAFDERVLLRLLASGITDESVAQQLGVSRRTVQRKISDLIQRLGANSRFDAGLKAGRCGWI
ncbi:TrmB family transcriptional regulator [Streptomyces alkaliterrae]|uniref:HTH domain-containing protein n=1 Tax=Streptomyces alkaliterrae TaxID=2213162 RepID=A0A5P0YKM3_9ACTN|nr:TrmB family transcriptional regulator [Streptomyces alkaliterrae]MBB1259189.1 HTH domain-containing protein [Streptomyces alkaliterrae]MQS00788.1 HTH domain-containing protein [Streptomyces alkaliterrae]